MSRPSWPSSLARSLSDLRRPDGSCRVALVGVGHELRGDDAAGLVVARRLQARVAGRDGVLVIDAGSAPENHTSRLRRFGPDLVLLIDAAQMNAPPGEVRWVSWDETTGIGASTHTLPPYVLARFLTIELGCQVALLAVQPADTRIGTRLSPVIRRATAGVARELARLLRET